MFKCTNFSVKGEHFTNILQCTHTVEFFVSAHAKHNDSGLPGEAGQRSDVTVISLHPFGVPPDPGYGAETEAIILWLYYQDTIVTGKDNDARTR